MKTFLHSLTFVALGLVGLQAQLPDADDLLRTARYVTTAKDADLTGRLKKSGIKGSVPIALSLRENQGIEFQVYDGQSWNKFQLKLKDNEYDLYEGIGDKIRRFDRAKLTQPVMGTDLTYEDLAMSFLYWPDSKTIGEENLGISRDAWKVRLTNPRAVGDYKTVDVWIHKDSGALMQIYGYRADGQPVKVFKVTKLTRVGSGEYSIKTMKVETWKDGRAIGITSLDFDKPQKAKPQGLR